MIKSALAVVAIALGLLASPGCSTGDVKSGKEIDGETSKDEIVLDSTDYYFDLVLDSLMEDTANVELALACKNHFERSRIKFDPDFLSKDFILEYFNILHNDSLQVLEVDYIEWSHDEPKLLLYFINQEGDLLGKDSISGCHYHNGILQAEDWNRDGLDEFVFRLDYPTTSVYHDNDILSVYKLDANYRLHQIFNLTERTRDCAIPLDESYGTETVRKYFWINDRKIKISETVYKFDCETSRRDEPVEYLGVTSFASYSMIWNPDKEAFVEEL